MTALPKKKIYTPEEYLVLERKAVEKSEFHDGKIIQRASSNENHITLMMNVAIECRQQLKVIEAKVLMCDMKVRTLDSAYFLYPDVLIYTEKARFHDDEKDVMLNPQIIFEIVSNETSAFDRGDKFHIYQSFESLSEYVLIDQNLIAVERYIRQDNKTWIYKSFTDLADEVQLSSIGISAKLRNIYSSIEFEKENL